jgi:hypothetical protein
MTWSSDITRRHADVFGCALTRQLDQLALTPELHARVMEQRTRLAAPDLSTLPSALHGQLQHAFEQAFVTGFRALMLARAGLCMLASLASASLLARRVDLVQQEL